MSKSSPLFVGTLIVLSLGAFYWVSKKPSPPRAKKGASFMLFDDSCEQVEGPTPSDEEGQKFVLKHFEMYKKQVPLGPPPGTVDVNVAWVEGFAEHLIAQLVSPKCLATVRADEEQRITPALSSFIASMTLGAAVFLMERGYNVMGPTGPGMEASGEGSSLVDLVRGLR